MRTVSLKIRGNYESMVLRDILSANGYHCKKDLWHEYRDENGVFNLIEIEDTYGGDETDYVDTAIPLSFIDEQIKYYSQILEVTDDDNDEGRCVNMIDALNSLKRCWMKKVF